MATSFLCRSYSAIRWLLRQWYLRAFGSILIAVLVLCFDVLGLRSLTDSYSRNLFIPVMASFYPPEGQRHVATVIIDDSAADEIAERYPIGLSEHGRLLRRVLCEGPSVILVAVSFRYLRDGDAGVEALKSQLRFRRLDGECRQVTDAEARAGRAADAQGRIQPVTKVFLAAAAETRGRCVPFSATLHETCTEARKIDSLKDVAEPIVFGKTTLDNSYALWRPVVEKGPLVAAPAIHAFKAFCERAGAGFATCARPLAPSEAALVVHWGLYPPALQRQLDTATRRLPPRKPCLGDRGHPASFAGRVQDAFRVLEHHARINALGNPDEEAVEPHPACRYTSEVNAAALLFRPVGDPLLTEALRDRIVVYGIDIAGIGGSELVPLFGRVPSAHFDAMVLDNLVSFGAAYKREPSKAPVAQVNVSWLNLIELGWTSVMIVLGGWLSRKSMDRPPGLCGEPRIGLSWPAIAYYLIGLVLLCAVCLVAVLLLHWPAPNVVGMLGIKAFDSGTRAISGQHPQDPALPPTAVRSRRTA